MLQVIDHYHAIAHTNRQHGEKSKERAYGQDTAAYEGGQHAAYESHGGGQVDDKSEAPAGESGLHKEIDPDHSGNGNGHQALLVSLHLLSYC